MMMQPLLNRLLQILKSGETAYEDKPLIRILSKGKHRLPGST